MIYSHLLLNSRNLELGHGKYPDELFSRVLDGIKPVGFLDSRQKEVIDGFEVRARAAGLAFFRRDFGIAANVWFLSVAIDGVIREVLDVSAVVATYVDAGLPDDITALVVAELARIAPLRFDDFLKFDDCEADPTTIHEYARTGLLLGYPLESTIALMRAHIPRLERWRIDGWWIDEKGARFVDAWR